MRVARALRPARPGSSPPALQLLARSVGLSDARRETQPATVNEVSQDFTRVVAVQGELRPKHLVIHRVPPMHEHKRTLEVHA